MPASKNPPPDDPRFVPGAYVTNGHQLFEVREHVDGKLRLLDCKDETPWQASFKRVLLAYRLVRAAPQCPDTPVLDEAGNDVSL